MSCPIPSPTARPSSASGGFSSALIRVRSRPAIRCRRAHCRLTGLVPSLDAPTVSSLLSSCTTKSLLKFRPGGSFQQASHCQFALFDLPI